MVAVITRHPMVEEDLIEALDRWASGDVRRALSALSSGGKAQVVFTLRKEILECKGGPVRGRRLN